jgi:hypothetical protein
VDRHGTQSGKLTGINRGDAPLGGSGRLWPVRLMSLLAWSSVPRQKRALADGPNRPEAVTQRAYKRKDDSANLAAIPDGHKLIISLGFSYFELP